MNPRDGEEFLKEKRFIIVHLVIVLIVQVIVLLGYYFKEKQTILAFPMILVIYTASFSKASLTQLLTKKTLPSYP